MQLLKPTWVNHDGDKSIFSVDIHPDGTRFATGGQGQDSSGRVVIWNMRPVVSDVAEAGDSVPKLLCQLDQHLGCVNSVRWSHSGRLLASAGDDKVIMVWQKSNYGGSQVFGSNVTNVESWRIVTTLRGHNGDILDVAWSPGDVWLASASIDNNVIVWNAAKWPEQIRTLRGHTGLVKGVTWDPVGRYLASQSDDRSLRVWRTSDWAAEEVITESFTECGGTTTVLRPSWSPDGQYLVSAHSMNNGGPTAQIIERDGWNTEKDFVGHRKPVTCVRFNPNTLKKADQKTGKSVQYCCVAIGSRDRSLSIWLTSLKRPLVVIHDIFDDSVLDLSWSQNGQHLMAVSKDGTLAFIHLSPEELGTSLSEEETNVLLMKLYGKTGLTSASANKSIIENPELILALEERAEYQSKLENKSFVTPNVPTTPMRTAINKQIESRTADGKRRITPMFIPRPPDFDSSSRTSFEGFEASFSSSQQERSQIVIERVDDPLMARLAAPGSAVVEISMPKLPTCPPFKVDRTPANEKVTPLSPSSVGGIKRKHEDSIQSSGGLLIKRKRGRPPLCDRQLSASRSRDPSPPPPARVAPVTVLNHASRVAAVEIQPLPDATIESPLRLHVTGKFPDGKPALLLLENNCSLGESCVGIPLQGGGQVALHRLTMTWGSGGGWVAFVTSPVVAVVAGEEFVTVACRDKSLHIVDARTGDLTMPPLQLTAATSQLSIDKMRLICITTDAQLSIWDIEGRKKLLCENVRHLVMGRRLKSIHLTPDGNPVVLLISGEAFVRCPNLESWLLLGDNVDVRSAVHSEVTLLPACHKGDFAARPLAGLLHMTAAYSTSSRVGRSVLSDSVRQALTEAFLNRMLTSARYLGSPHDFKFWLKRKIQFFIKEGLEQKLRNIFDDLLGPFNANKSEECNVDNGNCWQPKLMEMDKHILLKEFLQEILLAENSLNLQRLFTEYKEQLDTNTIDAI